jgi:hypothetical protein
MIDAPADSSPLEAVPSALVIGDIHHDVDGADHLLAKHRSRAQRVVFLGDVFDSLGDRPAQMQRSCEWLAAMLADPRSTVVAGNHDLSYCTRGSRAHFCPGWTPDKQRIFERVCGDLARERMRLALQVGPWLLTHAGVTADLAANRSAAQLVSAAATAWSDAMAGRKHPLLGCGRPRGGADAVGGLTWCDWRSEFRPTASIHQICGHTRCRGVVRGRHLARDGAMSVTEAYDEDPVLRLGVQPVLNDGWASINYCIDCDLAFACLLTPSGFELLPA